MSFRKQEKDRYALVKKELFSPSACQAGIYYKNQRSYEFCLSCASENLHGSLRRDALRYFESRSINWHDGSTTCPSNHMCCSQSACINSLWHFTSHPHFLVDAFKQYYPQFAEAMPFYADGLLPNDELPYMAFEWIGTHNYLGEKEGRQRGANATSADFAFRFRRQDGKIQLVLGEWKYTEFYSSPEDKAAGQSGQTRLSIYQPAFQRWQAQQRNLPPYSEFFKEPAYQLMRLTLLAQEMEAARIQGDGEMESDIVSVLHIAPAANIDFTNNLAAFPTLQQFGNTVGSAWSAIAPKDRFLSIATESLYDTIKQTCPAHLQSWRSHLLSRYGW